MGTGWIMHPFCISMYVNCEIICLVSNIGKSFDTRVEKKYNLRCSRNYGQNSQGINKNKRKKKYNFLDSAPVFENE